jgi:hypothetical protein
VEKAPRRTIVCCHKAEQISQVITCGSVTVVGETKIQGCDRPRPQLKQATLHKKGGNILSTVKANAIRNQNKISPNEEMNTNSREKKITI